MISSSPTKFTVVGGSHVFNVPIFIARQQLKEHWAERSPTQGPCLRTSQRTALGVQKGSPDNVYLMTLCWVVQLCSFPGQHPGAQVTERAKRTAGDALCDSRFLHSHLMRSWKSWFACMQEWWFFTENLGSDNKALFWCLMTTWQFLSPSPPPDMKLGGYSFSWEMN